MLFWSNKSLVEVCSFFKSSIWSPLSLYGATLFSRLSYTFPDQWPLSKEKSTQTWHLLWATPDPLGAGFRPRVGWPVRMHSSQPNSHCGFHFNVVSLAWKKTFFCLHWLVFWGSEWWRTQSVPKPSVNGGLSNPSSPPTLSFYGGRVSGRNSNTPSPSTPALLGYFLSYNLPWNKKAPLGKMRGREGHFGDSCLGSIWITGRESGRTWLCLPIYR